MVIVMVMEYNCCNDDDDDDDDDDDIKSCDEWAKACRQPSCPVMMFNTNESAGVTPRPCVTGSSECDTAISRSFL